ncbi:hypothetical protein C2S51_036090 [Perilla frutescens var. frutescens]|nr:hypothetical protein C2S51_036090 [Perilla frutescens var. frutescens]
MMLDSKAVYKEERHEVELRASVFEATEEENRLVEKDERLPPALLGSCNGGSSVGFVHFTNRSDLDRAVRELDGKTVGGPRRGQVHVLQVVKSTLGALSL